MVYYFKYFVNTKLTTTTTCKGQIFSCYLIKKKCLLFNTQSLIFLLDFIRRKNGSLFTFLIEVETREKLDS